MPRPISLVVKNGSNMWARISGVMPFPVSATDSSTYRPGVIGWRARANVASISTTAARMRNLAACRHRIAGVDGEIDDCLLDLAAVPVNRRQLRSIDVASSMLGPTSRSSMRPRSWTASLS